MVRAGLSTERVVSTAADLVDETGFAQLSLAALSDRLLVRVPSLYKHIGGIGDLRERLGRLAREQLDGEIQSAVSGLYGRAALLALLRAHRTYAMTHPGRYAAFLQLPETMPTATLARVIGECAVPVAQVPIVTHAVRCVMRGFLILMANGEISAGPESDDVFAAILELLDHGLLPLGSRSRLLSRSGQAARR